MKLPFFIHSKYRKSFGVFLNKKVSLFFLFFFVFFLAFLLWVNFTNQSTIYGINYGKSDDQADSYSEYLIRNTLINDFIGSENSNGSLIITDGYSKTPLDFSYFSFNTTPYTHSRSIQHNFYYELIKKFPDNFIDNQPIFNSESFNSMPKILLGLQFVPKSLLRYLHINTTRDVYFQFFRFLNCLLLSLCITVFFVSLYEKRFMTILLISFYSMVSGVALFSSNLYLCFWAMFTPFLCFSALRNKSHSVYDFLLPLFFSFLYFSFHYLFAATFAILWLLPFFFSGRIIEKGIAAKFFLISAGVISGFFLEIVCHINYVSEGFNIDFDKALSLIFVSTKARILSLSDVPFPFWIGFFKSMIVRLSWDGIRIPLFVSVSKMIFLIILFVFFRQNISNMRNVCVWALLAYCSCYLFSYQHIMYHDFYDTLIFAITVQLAVFIVLGAYLKNKYAPISS